MTLRLFPKHNIALRYAGVARPVHIKVSGVSAQLLPPGGGGLAHVSYGSRRRETRWTYFNENRKFNPS